MSKSDLLPVEEVVQSQLRDCFAGRERISLVIGVSGGVDSMCLLYILNKLDIELYIVHINYQKRGAASDKDAALVETISAKFGIDLDVITVNPDEAEGHNFQQWAREVRYGAFAMKANQISADGIALAHHQDDQIETILQKIFRGSGLASWSAMKVWDGHLFRPLLRVSREEIEQYCQAQSIPFRHDESNFTSDFARNFLRNQWLPELEQHFPGWRSNVLRIAEQARIFASSLQFILHHLTEENDRLRRKGFLQLEHELQKSVILYYINQIDGNAEVSRAALKEIAKLKELQTGKSIQLTKNIELMRDRDYLKVAVDTGDSGAFFTLQKADLQENGISFNGLQFRLQPYKNPDFDEALYIDIDTEPLSWPLCIRTWKKGDQFQPLGMNGHQSVADHLTNRKVSATEKQHALVLESFEETICAVIFPPIENLQPPGTISEQVKCNSSTRQCLVVKRIL